MSTSPVSGSVLTTLLAWRIGIETPKTPVKTSGCRKLTASGKSPRHLPQKSWGVTRSNESAICLLPVPPTSHPSPAATRSWRSGFRKKTYFSETSMLSKPFNVTSCAWSRILYVPATLTPRSGLRRLAISALSSVSFVADESLDAGVLMCETVGNDSSSATNGSSIASVAGRKHLPMKPCASAPRTQLLSTITLATSAQATRAVFMAILRVHPSRDGRAHESRLITVRREPRLYGERERWAAPLGDSEGTRDGATRCPIDGQGMHEVGDRRHDDQRRLGDRDLVGRTRQDARAQIVVVDVVDGV